MICTKTKLCQKLIGFLTYGIAFQNLPRHLQILAKFRIYKIWKLRCYNSMFLYNQR